MRVETGVRRRAAGCPCVVGCPINIQAPRKLPVSGPRAEGHRKIHRRILTVKKRYLLLA